MNIDYYVVFMKDPGRPFKISAATFMDFLRELQDLVARYSPFELIYRG